MTAFILWLFIVGIAVLIGHALREVWRLTMDIRACDRHIKELDRQILDLRKEMAG